ncbi:hypothetical protein [Lysobacter hankyongensis]
MRLRALLFVAGLAHAGVVSAWIGPDHRQLHIVRAGETTLTIEVVGIEDPARVAMLQRWAEEAARATLPPSGRFPLEEAYVRILEIDSRDDSPVPWGQISRDDTVSVLLYVRRDAADEALRADWTAVHEFSHLAHPYLGERGRWLAEGLASYHQNLLRARAGLLAPDEAWRRLDAGFRRGEAAGPGPALDAIGRRRDGTMRVYWGGAAYWLEMDLALRRDHGTTLQEVLDRHARCCLDGVAQVAPEDFVAALDRSAGIDLFARRYRDYAEITTFPSLDESYRALGIAREGDAIVLSVSPETRALREALTAPLRPAARR